MPADEDMVKFSCFSQWGEWLTINTFLHSVHFALPTFYWDHYLNVILYKVSGLDKLLLLKITEKLIQLSLDYTTINRDV